MVFNIFSAEEFATVYYFHLMCTCCFYLNKKYLKSNKQTQQMGMGSVLNINKILL